MVELKIDHYSPVPLHFQIEQLLRQLIKEQAYIDGKLLPGEAELASTLKTSRNTVRQAINKLVSEGLLLRKKGVGTMVLQQQLYSKVSNWFSFTRELQERGIKVKTYQIIKEHVIPPKEVALLFKIHPDTAVFKLQRIRGDERTPFVFFLSYFNPELGLTGEEDFSIPLYEMIESQYQVVAARSYEELKATTADVYIAGQLNISEHDPVLSRKRLVYDESQVLIEYNMAYYIGEKFTHIIESERKL